MKGWHFLNSNGRLGHDDGRLVKVGEKLTVEEPLFLCRWGLHASRLIMDALRFSCKSPRLCRVELSGTVLHDFGKSCATERTVLWMLDSETTEALLADFARRCALDVVHLWDAPKAVLNYLKTGSPDGRDAAHKAAVTALTMGSFSKSNFAVEAAFKAIVLSPIAEDAWAAAIYASSATVSSTITKQNRRLASMAVAAARA